MYLFCSIHLQFHILGSVCPTKKYCPAGTGVPLDCAPGSYMNHTQASKCYDCPAGFYCVDADIQECLQGITKFEQVLRVAFEIFCSWFWHKKKQICLRKLCFRVSSGPFVHTFIKRRLLFITLLGFSPNLPGPTFSEKKDCSDLIIASINPLLASVLFHTPWKH